MLHIQRAEKVSTYPPLARLYLVINAIFFKFLSDWRAKHVSVMGIIESYMQGLIEGHLLGQIESLFCGLIVAPVINELNVTDM